ncbi:50S ribosome-binding GTPase [Spirulina major CS-329]|uniref:GTPase family protein n=1 Tax=Spirulina TaxID=1154 RepID=UPI00232CC45E|nr:MULTISPECIES: GTPase [Spirulina]MDB9495998.1 50S ribosome-binding GTPase [Spirulina subsalsa CS-330]MDB9502901.1 50S ribosome-binding GTPase [Spirulina major CS-329]
MVQEKLKCLNKVFKYLPIPRRNTLTVVFFGKTGVGKSSTLNALFELNWPVDNAVACTRKPQFTDFKPSDHLDVSYQNIRVVDLPGISESLIDDQKYMGYYKKWIPQADSLVWVTQADTRAYKQDEIFLKKLNPLFKKSLFFIVALNKIDCMGIYEGDKPFDTDNGKPSEDQIKLIPEKIDDIYTIFKNAIDKKIIFKKEQIIPYTSVHKWKLDILKSKILLRS